MDIRGLIKNEEIEHLEKVLEDNQKAFGCRVVEIKMQNVKALAVRFKEGVEIGFEGLYTGTDTLNLITADEVMALSRAVLILDSILEKIQNRYPEPTFINFRIKEARREAGTGDE